MFGGRLDLWKGPRAALRGVALSILCGLSAAVALAFLCAALFVVALERYGAVNACLGAAVVFLIVAIVIGLVQAALTKRRKREARDAATGATLATLADPRAILVGLQIAQAIGLKRLLPLLAVAGAGFALVSGLPDGLSRREARRARRSGPAAPNPPND